jgi:hypothetical protein
MPTNHEKVAAAIKGFITQSKQAANDGNHTLALNKIQKALRIDPQHKVTLRALQVISGLKARAEYDYETAASVVLPAEIQDKKNKTAAFITVFSQAEIKANETNYSAALERCQAALQIHHPHSGAQRLKIHLQILTDAADLDEESLTSPIEPKYQERSRYLKFVKHIEKVIDENNFKLAGTLIEKAKEIMLIKEVIWNDLIDKITAKLAFELNKKQKIFYASILHEIFLELIGLYQTYHHALILDLIVYKAKHIDSIKGAQQPKALVGIFKKEQDKKNAIEDDNKVIHQSLSIYREMLEQHQLTNTLLQLNKYLASLKPSLNHHLSRLRSKQKKGTMGPPGSCAGALTPQLPTAS